MRGFLDISDSELEVMEMLWKQGSRIKQTELLAVSVASGKNWKRQTLNTFLSRLESKGLVKRANRTVETIYSRDEYSYIQVKAAIDCLYDGQLSDFMLAFAQNNEITEKNAKELIRIIENC
ncbi:MAG: BlaI/MecI/CopY family transcriptional regulator [Lachnospiraceae bacterium]|nr:BlaI/MecI/CopY family transcriptional regulator [Lachnospiraceae bacterium]